MPVSLRKAIIAPIVDENGIEEHPSRAARTIFRQKEDSEGESDQHKLVVERVDKVVSDQQEAIGKREEQTICGRGHNDVRFGESNRWITEQARC